MNNIDLVRIIAEAIKNDVRLNENHYLADVNGEILMFNPFTYEPCLSIMRKMDDGDRKEFQITINTSKADDVK